MGLRSLPDSERRDGGERERRSNRDVLLGSGSVWSKRERFTVRRSDSSMPGGIRNSTEIWEAGRSLHVGR